MATVKRDYDGLSCLGAKYHELNNYACPHCRACRFDNVCLNHSTLQIQYYAGKTVAPLFYDSMGVGHMEFPEDFVNTGNPVLVCWSLLPLTDTAGHLLALQAMFSFFQCLSHGDRPRLQTICQRMQISATPLLLHMPV